MAVGRSLIRSDRGGVGVVVEVLGDHVRAVLEVFKELTQVVHIQRKGRAVVIGTHDLNVAGLRVEVKRRSIPCGVMKHDITVG